jgi:hypothetical protein
MILFEILKSIFSSNIQWEQQNSILRVGYFSIDNEIVYGIRETRISHKEIDYASIRHDIVFVDFGYFLNGNLKYNLLKQSTYPLKVLGIINSEITKVAKDNIVIFFSKRGEDDDNSYNKRTSFYERMVTLNSGQRGYTSKVIKLNSDETMFMISKQDVSQISKKDLAKLGKELDEQWSLKKWINIKRT